MRRSRFNSSSSSRFFLRSLSTSGAAGGSGWRVSRLNIASVPPGRVQMGRKQARITAIVTAIRLRCVQVIDAAGLPARCCNRLTVAMPAKPAFLGNPIGAGKRGRPLFVPRLRQCANAAPMLRQCLIAQLARSAPLRQCAGGVWGGEGAALSCRFPLCRLRQCPPFGRLAVGCLIRLSDDLTLTLQGSECRLHASLPGLAIPQVVGHLGKLT